MFNSTPEYMSAFAAMREDEIRRMGLVREAQRLTRASSPDRHRMLPRIFWGRTPGALQNPAVAKS
jgi:hypothetical protein